MYSPIKMFDAMKGLPRLVKMMYKKHFLKWFIGVKD
jgi:hypothetical protein